MVGHKKTARSFFGGRKKRHAMYCPDDMQIEIVHRTSESKNRVNDSGYHDRFWNSGKYFHMPIQFLLRSGWCVYV